MRSAVKLKPYEFVGQHIYTSIPTNDCICMTIYQHLKIYSSTSSAPQTSTCFPFFSSKSPQSPQKLTSHNPEWFGNHLSGNKDPAMELHCHRFHPSLEAQQTGSRWLTKIKMDDWNTKTELGSTTPLGPVTVETEGKIRDPYEKWTDYYLIFS